MTGLYSKKLIQYFFKNYVRLFLSLSSYNIVNMDLYTHRVLYDNTCAPLLQLIIADDVLFMVTNKRVGYNGEELLTKLNIYLIEDSVSMTL